MMTPSMRLSAIIASYRGDDESVKKIRADLERAYALGHEFGIERSAEVVDRCNRDGPYNAIGAASRIRALQVRHPNASAPPPEVTDEF